MTIRERIETINILILYDKYNNCSNNLIDNKIQCLHCVVKMKR